MLTKRFINLSSVQHGDIMGTLTDLKLKYTKYQEPDILDQSINCLRNGNGSICWVEECIQSTMSCLSFNIQQQKHLIEFQLIAMTSKKPLMICDTFVIFVFRPKVQIIENA